MCVLTCRVSDELGCRCREDEGMLVVIVGVDERKISAISCDQEDRLGAGRLLFESRFSLGERMICHARSR